MNVSAPVQAARRLIVTLGVGTLYLERTNRRGSWSGLRTRRTHAAFVLGVCRVRRIATRMDREDGRSRRICARVSMTRARVRSAVETDHSPIFM